MRNSDQFSCASCRLHDFPQFPHQSRGFRLPQIKVYPGKRAKPGTHFHLNLKAGIWDVALIKNSWADFGLRDENESILQPLKSILFICAFKVFTLLKLIKFTRKKRIGAWDYWWRGSCGARVCFRQDLRMERVSGTWCWFVSFSGSLVAHQFSLEAINVLVDGVSCRRRVLLALLYIVTQQRHPQVARVLNDVLDQSDGVKTAG